MFARFCAQTIQNVFNKKQVYILLTVVHTWLEMRKSVLPRFLNLTFQTLIRALRAFLPEGHINYYTTVWGVDILRNVTVSVYVTFYQINTFSVLYYI